MMIKRFYLFFLFTFSLAALYAADNDKNVSSKEATKNGVKFSTSGGYNENDKTDPKNLQDFYDKILYGKNGEDKKNPKSTEIILNKDNNEKEKDPFAFNLPDRSDSGFVPAHSRSIPAGIKVISILFVKGKKALAVLYIPGSSSEDLHFVHEGDVIPIEDNSPSKVKVTNKRKRNKNTASIAKARVFYLSIIKISKNHVEISPQTRPQDARIIR
jgi:hypothetical protein